MNKMTDARVKKGAPRLPRLRGHDVYSPTYKVPDQFHVYAYLDSERRPLYVGMTYDVQGRNSEHHARSHWYPFAFEFRVLWTTTDKREALAAEAKAIRELGPTFNVMHNRRAA